MSDSVTGLIRTAVPVIVGAVLAWLAARGLDLPQDQVTGVVQGALTLGWWVVVHLLERRWPAAGVMLGVPRVPRYEPPASPGA